MNIIKKCDHFSQTQNLQILKLLSDMKSKSGSKVQIIEHADGSRINLNLLTEEQLATLEKKVEEIGQLDPVHRI